ncbi:MAG: ExeM/NucH family extracellular endonuclease [Marinobacter sp.]|nr:ExeM/NucH family extracellular endonuclease [Marinobacter sp.]
MLLFTACALADDCGLPAVPIARIQGDGSQSPLTGKAVTVEAVVTFDASHRGGFGGFYLQQADTETDGNPATSEALFVYSDRLSPRPGQRLRVSGKVQEYHGLTELSSVTTITPCGKADVPEPVPVSLPWPAGRRPENLEGMRVRLASPLVVIDHFNLHRYGTLTLAPQPQPVPTQILPPGPAARALHRRQQQRRLLLDDGLSRQFPDPVPYPQGGLSLGRSLRAGSTVSGLTGVLDYRYGAWRLHPEASPRFQASTPRPPAPPRADGTTVRVVTLNLGNYFNGDAGRFAGSRGARNPDQLARQTRRLVAALTGSDADIAAVTELENDGYHGDSALAELARALGPDWHYIRRQGDDGDDAIRVALLYRHSRVVAVGPAQSPPPQSILNRGRPPLLQRFQPIGGGAAVAVAVAHFKSKSCHRAEGRQQDQGDGQGCYAARRMASAQALAAWLTALPTPTDSAGTLVTGDLNSYAREHPIQRLMQAGYTDLINRDDGAPASSFRFHGRSGTLDYALADAALLPRVRQARIWAINADEPRALGYASEGTGPATVPAVPWRSSDHDPVITDLAL